LLITGPGGVGKTTLCLRTVALAKEARYSCAGLLTLREDDDRRVVVDVRTGDRRALTAVALAVCPWAGTSLTLIRWHGGQKSSPTAPV
jgi:Predicted nucleotide kinase